VSGCHVPPLCIGMEYAKTGNLQVSDQFFTHTLSICAMDPLVFNEIGVLRYLQVRRLLHIAEVCPQRRGVPSPRIGLQMKVPQGNYAEAAEAFEKVIELSKSPLMKHHMSETAEASLFNLAHCYRKMLRLDDAVEMYKRALRCIPNKASTYTALAFAYHLKSDFDSAINYYHKVVLNVLECPSGMPRPAD
jgi:anaphase-promoting complex subunit 6